MARDPVAWLAAAVRVLTKKLESIESELAVVKRFQRQNASTDSHSGGAQEDKSNIFEWNRSAEPFVPLSPFALFTEPGVYDDELFAPGCWKYHSSSPSLAVPPPAHSDLPSVSTAVHSATTPLALPSAPSASPKALGSPAFAPTSKPAPEEPRLEQGSGWAAADSPLNSRSMTEHPKWNDFDLFCSRLHSNVRYDLTLDNFKNFLGEYGPTVPFDAISSGSFEADTLLDSPFCQIDECIPQVVRAMRSCVWALREGVYFGEHPGDDPSVMAARGKFVLSHLVTGGPGGSESTDLEGVAALLERSIGLAFRLLRQLPDQSSARLKEFLSYALREKEKCSGPALVELNAVLEALLSQALDGMGA